MHIAEARMLGALALVVEYLGRQVVVVIAAFQQTVGKVDVFPIHKEVFVEQPHTVDRLPTEQTEGTAHHLDACRGVPRQVAHVVTGKPPAVRKTTAQPHHLVKSHDGPWQSAPRLAGIAAVGLQHAHPERPGIGMRIHEAECLVQRRLTHDGVGVEQQHILTRRIGNGQIVGPGKTEVVPAGDDRHFGKLPREIFHAAIARMVVHHHHLRVDARQGSPQRTKALPGIVFHIIVDNDNRQFLHHESLVSPETCFRFPYRRLFLPAGFPLTPLAGGHHEQQTE